MVSVCELSLEDGGVGSACIATAVLAALMGDEADFESPCDAGDDDDSSGRVFGFAVDVVSIHRLIRYLAKVWADV